MQLALLGKLCSSREYSVDPFKPLDLRTLDQIHLFRHSLEVVGRSPPKTMRNNLPRNPTRITIDTLVSTISHPLIQFEEDLVLGVNSWASRIFGRAMVSRLPLLSAFFVSSARSLHPFQSGRHVR